MARGRPKRNSVQVTFRLDFNYMEKLKLLNPQLLTRDQSGSPKFRHGALGRYLERLIREDLEKRETLTNSPELPKFEELGKEPEKDVNQ